MLIEFSVSNCFSFKEKVTLNMVAASYKDLNDHKFDIGNDICLLKSIAIFGSNASGKSNLFKAMSFFRKFVIKSSEGNKTTEIPIKKFRLAKETVNSPSEFEIVVNIEDVFYRYGFKINNHEVIEEWLLSAKKERETKLFVRKDKNIDIKSKNFIEGKGLEEKTRNNSLFLSVVAQFNGAIANKLMNWFNNFNLISASKEDFSVYTSSLCENAELRKVVVQFMKQADLHIDDIQIEQEVVEGNIGKHIRSHKLLMEKDGSLKMLKLSTLHKVYDNGKICGNVHFDMDTEESEGTRKFFSLVGPIIDTLRYGKTLFIDELDNSLHPLLVVYLIKLFNSSVNKNKAQFIFISHDKTLFNQEYLRRDQIWITEKDKFQATKLFSLEDYNLRNDLKIEKSYLEGRFGGIPILDKPENIKKLIFG
ncbi:ATP-binding protein [bacterium]|nr:ATP-binding protein [bacterium]